MKKTYFVLTALIAIAMLAAACAPKAPGVALTSRGTAEPAP